MMRLGTVSVLSMLMTMWLAGAASAEIFTDFYDFSDTQYTDDFTAIRRGSQIKGDGVEDLGGTGHTALNFTGKAGPAGDTWLAKWTPGGAPGIFKGRCGTAVGANVLIHPFNNRKGAGVVALLNDANRGDKGLAVVLYGNGNTDAVQLATIDSFTGKLVPLKTAPLIAPVKENAWYAVIMELTVDLAVEGHSLLVEAFVLSLQDPTNPNSDFDRMIGFLHYTTWQTSLEEIGLEPQGQVGIMASAINAAIDSSVTNWAAIEGNEGPCWE